MRHSSTRATGDIDSARTEIHRLDKKIDRILRKILILWPQNYSDFDPPFRPSEKIMQRCKYMSQEGADATIQRRIAQAKLDRMLSEADAQVKKMLHTMFDEMEMELTDGAATATATFQVKKEESLVASSVGSSSESTRVDASIATEYPQEGSTASSVSSELTGMDTAVTTDYPREGSTATSSVGSALTPPIDAAIAGDDVLRSEGSATSSVTSELTSMDTPVRTDDEAELVIGGG